MDKTVIELFAGVGGFRCGLNKVTLKRNKVVENGNWEFVFANQWEPSTKLQHAFECYTTRFGSEHASNENINEIDKRNLPNHNLLVGGFPCQDYSVARSKKNEQGIEGKKGVLWWDIYDILIEKRPSFVLLENVDRLLIAPSSQRGRDFAIMLKCFSECGYNVEWRVINAADYGMQQKRRRVFIFAYLQTTLYNEGLNEYSIEEVVMNEGMFAQEFPIEEYTENRTVNFDLNNNDIVEVSESFDERFYNSGFMRNGVVETFKYVPVKENFTPLKKVLQKNDVDSKYFLTSEQHEKISRLKDSKRILRTRDDGSTYYYSEGKMNFPEDLNSPARTMLTSESSINRSTHVVKDLQTKKERFITPVEAERINGFPDGWTNTGMTEKRRYFMMGNALVIGIVERIANQLNVIFDNEPNVE